MTVRPEPHDLPASNPFATPWAAPFRLPDFARITTPEIAAAAATGLDAQRAEWEAIATNPAPPDVANTLEALEGSGELLDRVLTVFHTLVSSCADDELRALEVELAPQLAAHEDALYLDRRIFARLRALDEAAGDERTAAPLEPETAQLLAEYLKDFRHAGVELHDAEQARLRDYNARITSLETQFAQLVVAAMDDGALVIDDADDLAGLDDETLAALRRAAADRQREGYVISLQLPTQQALAAQLRDREVRRRLHEASITRGTGTHARSDTRALVLELARLRAERAQLLGHAHHADYVARTATAGTSEAINEMLGRLTPPAVANARAEAADLALRQNEPFAAWDWAWQAEAARHDRFALDDAALRPYLELDRVLTDGVFYAAERLFGITLTPRPDLRGYAEDVRVWEVIDDDGEALGLFLGDFYTRPGKRGGAWMHNLVDESHLLGHRPVVVNNLNITPPAPGEPTLLTWDEVITAFHEFGHALHGLLSDVRYPSLSGTNVPRDFVEFPSQVYEIWATHPQVISRYARHHRSGEPLDDEAIAVLQEASNAGQGFATTEYLKAALLDQAWHQLGPEELPREPQEVVEFERAALERAGAGLELVPPRYRSTYFNHVFGGGYDAAYYSYIWAEVLDADAVEWLATEAARGADGGLNREAGQRLREELLSRGNSRDPLESYRRLRGRDAQIGPLLRRRGLEGGAEGTDRVDS
ncbi:MAG TPA: M3 family metallopeptidase [Actinomycetaceae bacterium]|nr:M3 family metallopeptidase [Actinomycetaceae bacterium]